MYFNSASKRSLLHILKTLQESYKKGGKYTVNWYYEDVDVDIRFELWKEMLSDRSARVQITERVGSAVIEPEINLLRADRSALSYQLLDRAALSFGVCQWRNYAVVGLRARDLCHVDISLGIYGDRMR